MTRPILMAACVVFCLTYGIRGQQPLPAKVALVCSQEVEPARNVRDLALAKLGTDGNIALLDRATIERLLGEQKLSLSGLVDAATAVRAGKILAVDLFAMVEYSPEAKQNAGIVVFDAATGVKFSDSGFRDAAPEPQAMHVVNTVRAAASKWRAGTKNLKTLCFMPVRNADLPRSIPIVGDRIFLQQIDGLKRHDGGLVAYDLTANEFTLVHGKAANGYGGMKSTDMPPDLSIPFGRHLLHLGHYWSAYPFGRYSLDGKHADLYPSLLGQSWTYNFSARVSLQAVSPSELLIGDFSGLYLMHLKAK